MLYDECPVTKSTFVSLHLYRTLRRFSLLSRILTAAAHETQDLLMSALGQESALQLVTGEWQIRGDTVEKF